MSLKLELIESSPGLSKCPDCFTGSPRWRVEIASWPVKTGSGKDLVVCSSCATKMEEVWEGAR